jgi:hypothetical protein
MPIVAYAPIDCNYFLSDPRWNGGVRLAFNCEDYTAALQAIITGIKGSGAGRRTATYGHLRGVVSLAGTLVVSRINEWLP